MLLALRVGQRQLAAALDGRAPPARLGEHAHELLAIGELIQSRMLTVIDGSQQQLLGTGIRQDDFAELIDGQNRIGQSVQDFVQLIAFGQDTPGTHIRAGPRQLQFIRATGEFG